MANVINSTVYLDGLGENIDMAELRAAVEKVIEDAQSWHPRAWIDIQEIYKLQPDGETVISIEFVTHWDRGQKLWVSIAEALSVDTMTGSWDGECDPPKGTFAWGAETGYKEVEWIPVDLDSTMKAIIQASRVYIEAHRDQPPVEKVALFEAFKGAYEAHIDGKTEVLHFCQIAYTYVEDHDIGNVALGEDGGPHFAAFLEVVEDAGFDLGLESKL